MSTGLCSNRPQMLQLTYFFMRATSMTLKNLLARISRIENLRHLGDFPKSITLIICINSCWTKTNHLAGGWCFHVSQVSSGCFKLHWLDSPPLACYWGIASRGKLQAKKWIDCHLQSWSLYLVLWIGLCLLLVFLFSFFSFWKNWRRGWCENCRSQVSIDTLVY